MRATRILITADTIRWARIAAESMTGFATSVIACGCEAGIERELPPEETPDGRPGIAVLMFAMGGPDLAKQLVTRVGQCVLTCVGTACFSGLDGDATAPLGKALRYFADGFQSSKRLAGRRYWRLPVMDGEFLIEETAGVHQRRRRRQFPDAVHFGRGRPRCRRGRCRGDAPAAQHRAAVPGRRGPLGLQGRLTLQGPGRLHQRCLLPDHPRAERAHGAAARGRGGLGDRDRRPDRIRRRHGDRGWACAPPARSGAMAASWRSAPAIMAASSAPTISICGGSCNDRGPLRFARSDARCRSTPAR